MTACKRAAAPALILTAVLAFTLAAFIGNRQFDSCLGHSRSVARAGQCAGIPSDRPEHPAASPSPKGSRHHA